jgi:hypothetical protein
MYNIVAVRTYLSTKRSTAFHNLYHIYPFVKHANFYKDYRSIRFHIFIYIISLLLLFYYSCQVPCQIVTFSFDQWWSKIINNINKSIKIEQIYLI